MSLTATTSHMVPSSILLLPVEYCHNIPVCENSNFTVIFLKIIVIKSNNNKQICLVYNINGDLFKEMPLCNEQSTQQYSDTATTE